MSLAKDILRLVNERDELQRIIGQMRAELDVNRGFYDDLTEYCKLQDPDFINNWRRWSDDKTINEKMWDFGNLVGRAPVGPPRDFKFETNVPKLELEEEPMPEGCPGCGIKPSSTGRIEHAHSCPGRGIKGGENG